jgi:hypothetical protein
VNFSVSSSELSGGHLEEEWFDTGYVLSKANASSVERFSTADIDDTSDSVKCHKEFLKIF